MRIEMPRGGAGWTGLGCPGMVLDEKGGDAQGWWHTGRMMQHRGGVWMEMEAPGDAARWAGWRSSVLVLGGQDEDTIPGMTPGRGPRCPEMGPDEKDGAAVGRMERPGCGARWAGWRGWC